MRFPRWKIKCTRSYAPYNHWQIKEYNIELRGLKLKSMPWIGKNHSLKNYSFRCAKVHPLPIPTVLIKQMHQLINNFPEAVVVLSLGDLFAYLFIKSLWQTNMFFLNQRTWNGKNRVKAIVDDEYGLERLCFHSWKKRKWPRD